MAAAARTSARILVVEDDAAVAETVRDVLVEHGFSVTTADDGGAALRALGDDRFDAVLTDLSMPRMDGRRLVLAMRRRRIAVPVIVVSARPDTPAIVDRLGVAAYLLKPFDICALVDAVRAVLRPRREYATA